MPRIDSPMNQPVLAITGATGFIGQAVVRAAIAAGWQPRILVRRLPKSCLVAGHPIEVVQGDLDDTAALRKLVRGATAIVHLAGLIKALRPEDFLAANAGGTEQLLRAAAEGNPAAALVHVSSLAAREPQLSPYGASKRAGEHCVRELAGSRPWIIIRPPAVYGPGDEATLPLFKGAGIGFIPYPAVAGARVSLIHVADLANAIIASLYPLIDGGLQSGTIVEIDDGQTGGHDWAGIIRTLAEVVGHPICSVRLPRWVLVPIAAINQLRCRLRRRADVLSLAKLAELYHLDWVVAAGGLPASCHWQPRFPLRQGFQDTYQWYSSNSIIT